MAERGAMSVNKEGSLMVAAANNSGVEDRLDKIDKTLGKLKLESNLFIDPKYFREEFKGGNRIEAQKKRSNTWGA